MLIAMRKPWGELEHLENIGGGFLDYRKRRARRLTFVAVEHPWLVSVRGGAKLWLTKQTCYH